MLNRVVTAAALAVGGVLLSKQFKKKNRLPNQMASVEESIEINAPVNTAYSQWTRFEDFPQFMENVREVRQLDNKHLHWRATVAGKEVEWDAEIVEQIPDKRIAWRSISGPRNGGAVSFHRISPHTTRVTLKMEYEPAGPIEQVGDALGAVRMEARSGLMRFKEMLERRGRESGTLPGAATQH